MDISHKIGEILVATSSREFNKKSSLDILPIPHWTWNYSSTQRLPYKIQLREQERMKQKLLAEQNGGNQNQNNIMLNSLDDELDLDEQAEQQLNNPFIENQSDENISSDFVNRPSIIPLPYGARERCLTFSPSPNIVFVGTVIIYLYHISYMYILSFVSIFVNKCFCCWSDHQSTKFFNVLCNN